MIPRRWIRISQEILVSIVLFFIVFFFPLILDGVDEKASNTKSDSGFKVLRYYAGQLTLRRCPVQR